MPILDVRRHSMRKTDGGSQLSQEGVMLAREIGNNMGPFASVVTSVLPRARETAIAMGFAVDQELVTLAPEEVFAELQTIDWATEPDPFGLASTLIQSNGAYARYAHSIAAMWRQGCSVLVPPDLTGSGSSSIVGDISFKNLSGRLPCSRLTSLTVRTEQP